MRPRQSTASRLAAPCSTTDRGASLGPEPTGRTARCVGTDACASWRAPARIRRRPRPRPPPQRRRRGHRPDASPRGARTATGTRRLRAGRAGLGTANCGPRASAPPCHVVPVAWTPVEPQRPRPNFGRTPLPGLGPPSSDQQHPGGEQPPIRTQAVQTHLPCNASGRELRRPSARARASAPPDLILARRADVRGPRSLCAWQREAHGDRPVLLHRVLLQDLVGVHEEALGAGACNGLRPRGRRCRSAAPPASSKYARSGQSWSSLGPHLGLGRHKAPHTLNLAPLLKLLVRVTHATRPCRERILVASPRSTRRRTETEKSHIRCSKSNLLPRAYLE